MSVGEMIEKIRQAQRAKGPATVLAIGTAAPANIILQADYPDYYFRITKSEYLTVSRTGEKSMIRKRHMFLTEEIPRENPNVCAFMETTLDVRQDMANVKVPRLGKEAAMKVIEEWGQPKSNITHLVFNSTSGVELPGSDYQLTKLLGLSPDVKRL